PSPWPPPLVERKGKSASLGGGSSSASPPGRRRGGERLREPVEPRAHGGEAGVVHGGLAVPHPLEELRHLAEGPGETGVGAADFAEVVAVGLVLLPVHEAAGGEGLER